MPYLSVPVVKEESPILVVELLDPLSPVQKVESPMVVQDEPANAGETATIPSPTITDIAPITTVRFIFMVVISVRLLRLHCRTKVMLASNRVPPTGNHFPPQFQEWQYPVFQNTVPVGEHNIYKIRIRKRGGVPPAQGKVGESSGRQPPQHRGVEPLGRPTVPPANLPENKIIWSG